MTSTERLTEVFDRGLRVGEQALNPTDLALFRIQDFIIEFEMGGLSGYLYNRLPDLLRIRHMVTAMRQFNLTELADLLDGAAELFAGYADPDPPCTWVEVCRRYDPSDKIARLEKRIAALKDFGLSGSTIV